MNYGFNSVAFIGFPIRLCEFRLHVLVLHADAVVGLVADDSALLEHVAVLLRVVFDPHRRQLRWNYSLDAHRELRRNERLLIAAGGRRRMAQLQAVRSLT